MQNQPSFRSERAHNRRLLIVDDEQNVLSAVSRCLLDMPYQVLTASSGAEGLELLHQNNGVDLVISDFRMPGMNGVEFLQQVMKHWPETKRVILSAYTDSEILLSAVNEGRVHRFLTKPWKNELLLTEVNELLSETEALFIVRQEVEELVQRNQVLASTNDQLHTLLNDLLKAVRTENTAQLNVGTLAARTSEEILALKSLSERELQILKRLAIGQRPKEISQDLAISIKTVSTYKLRLYGKMCFRSEADLITFSIKHNLITRQ
jgi:DNA-binding NarL/FixJ family response regulator